MPVSDGAAHFHHELVADAPGDLGRLARLGLVDHYLGQAVAVAQVDEHEAAVLAAPVHPARDPNLAPGIGRAELAARDVAIGRGKAEGFFGRGRGSAGLTHGVNATGRGGRAADSTWS